MGAAIQQGSTGYNIARQCALRAGLPTSVAGMSVDRQCASGLMAISIAAKQIIDDGMSVTIGGGLESISLVQNDKMDRLPRRGSVARRPSRRHLHGDARNGRDRRRSAIRSRARAQDEFGASSRRQRAARSVRRSRPVRSAEIVPLKPA